MSAGPLISENKIRKETAKAIMQPAEDALRKFEPLLSRISAETLVIHFSCWLENKYFEDDENVFYTNALTYRHVLQNCLVRCKSVKNRSATELSNLTDAYLKKVFHYKELQKDTKDLFDATLAWLLADAEGEEYRHWGKVSESGAVILPDSCLPDDSLRAKKSFIYHTFEFQVCHSDEDTKYIDELNISNLSHETHPFHLSHYFGVRFLKRSCGSEMLEQFQSEQGWSPFDALTLLLKLYFCCIQEFWLPWLEVKNRDHDYMFSVGLECLDMIADENLQSFGERRLSFFNELAHSIFKNESISISENEIDKIFAEFTIDIHDKKALAFPVCNSCMPNKPERNPDDEKEFLLLKNSHCFFLIPRLFTHEGYIIETVYDLVFKKSKRLPSYFEKRIAGLFDDAQFVTDFAYGIFNFGGENLTDIDVIAYKDNILFIVQAKLSETRHIIDNIFYLPEKFEKAGKQLNKALEWLKKPENQVKVARDLCIATPFKELRIVPLIVSNSLEYDHKYFGGHLKISAFELEAALLGFKKETIGELNLRYQVFTGVSEYTADNNGDSFKTSLDPSSVTSEKYRLYPETGGTRFKKADETIRCIEEQRLWKLALNEDLPCTPIPTSTFD